MTPSHIPPGFLALHSHRSEVLADTLSAWLTRHPLAPLEQEVVLVQSGWSCHRVFCGARTDRCWARPMCRPIRRWTSCP